ncbi:lantibiotic dehydratase [Sphaerisporangium dianthi]|uniref:Lantibiotic dehydratase n=1 Tax=Sphaerisporangium dianthi TaxID=1436120 RepID=A0ABV9CN86_9ACTN
MTTTSDPGLYRPAGFFLLRAPTMPVQRLTGILAADTAQDATTGVADAAASVAAQDAVAGAARERLRELSEHPRVVQALHVASPSMTAGLAHLSGADAKRSARSYSTLLRYVTRMTSRPTPYGLFSAVGVGRFGDATSARVAPDPVARTRTRADAGWLLSLIKELEGDESLRDGLHVSVNPLLYRVGDRAVLSFADVHGTADNRHVGFRATAPVEVALETACVPGATYADIVDAIRARVPGATEDKARGLVAQLWDLHVLISDLRPAMTVPMPELDLLKRLDGVDGAASVRAELARARELADAIDDARGMAPVAALDGLSKHQRAMSPGHTRETYQVDTALALEEDGLSREVGAVAAEAAEVLLRVGVKHQRYHHIVEYHTAFLERYGVDAEVPLLEVLSPETGLDAPPTYTMPPRAVPLAAVPMEENRGRDMVVASLAADALHRGLAEVELTDELLERLTVWRSRGAQPGLRPSLDLYAQVAAESREAVDAGRFRLVVSPGAMGDGGRTFGRFFDLFDEDSIASLQEFARAEEELCPSAIFAELSYIPPHGRGGNVTVHPPLRRYEICVNTSPSVPPERRIPLGDILVGATADRFYLRSARHGREIRVTQSHMLSAQNAPNVCRALIELSEDGALPPAGFDWGPVAAAPYLPRVVRGKIVLQPAQWTVTRSMIGEGEFGPALQAWRRAMKVPRYVYLAWMDNRLLLDLTHPLCVAELADELTRAARAGNRVMLQEMLPALEEAWLDDPAGGRYLSEVVVPLLAREPALARRAAPPPAPPARDLPAVPRRRLVGDEWVYLKLYSAVSQHDDVIAGPLGELVAGLAADGLIDRWFYIRYCDPGPHLRIRVRAADLADVAQVTGRCVAWARGCVAAGLASDLALVGYDRELERYGGPHAIDVLEEVFAADSEVTADLVTLTRTGAVGLDPEVLGVMAVHTMYRDWGLDPIVIADVHGTEIDDALRKRFREIQRTLCDLLVPWDRHPDPVARAHLHTLGQVFAGRREVFAAAGAHVRGLAERGLLLGDERRIVASLAHMRVNRLLGMDQDRERAVHHLWLLAIRAIRGRPER